MVHCFGSHCALDDIDMLLDKQIDPQLPVRSESAWAGTRGALWRVGALPLMLLAIALPAWAQVPPARVPAGAADGVEGIIVNATITAAGQAFFRDFTELWREKPDGDTYNLDIVERPSRRFGNQIWVAFGQKRVFQGFLPIKLDRMRALGEQAVETTYANIITLGLMSPASSDPDVAVDEM